MTYTNYSRPVIGQICQVKCGLAWDVESMEHFNFHVGIVGVVLYYGCDDPDDNSDVCAVMFADGRVGYVSASFTWPLS